MNIKLPQITIVTVVYNAEKVIEDTIRSVLSQDYNHIEYIIVDGASTDSSLSIIEKYKDSITLISEPDKGVYDAMNKGIDRANGEWMLFMNAGDHFFSSSVVSSVMELAPLFNDYAVIYGDAEFRLKHIAYISEAAEEVTSSRYMPFSHQAAFTRTSVAKQFKFDLTYKIAADTAFFLCLVKNNYQMKHVPITICSYNALEGLSTDNDLKRSKEIVALQSRWNGVNPDSPHFKQYIKEAKKRQLIKKILPSYLWTILRERGIRKRYSNDKVYKIG